MKIGICGTQGTGKSTEAYELCLNYKKKHPDKTVGLFLEAVVHCPLEKDKVATQESELWMFGKQLEHEIYMSTKYDVVICDRTILDAIPYTRLLGYDDCANGMTQIAKAYINTYDDIIFKLCRYNDHCHDDGFRDTDKTYRKQIEDGFIELFSREFGIEISPYCEPQTIKHKDFNLVIK